MGPSLPATCHRETMNRRHILGLATVLVFATACQDINQAVGPTDVDAGPALSVQQQ
mgnify:CR=1 FL=1|jgi:hypothetical protein